MTHGLWNLRVKLDGEIITEAEPVIGYLHRGWEKMVESRDFQQIIPMADRLCYGASLTWSHLLLPFRGRADGARGPGPGTVDTSHNHRTAEDLVPPDVAGRGRHRPRVVHHLPLLHEGKRAHNGPHERPLWGQDDLQLHQDRRRPERPAAELGEGHTASRDPVGEAHTRLRDPLRRVRVVPAEDAGRRQDDRRPGDEPRGHWPEHEGQ